MEKIKVLLIEDNPGDAKLIQEMLTEAKNVSFDVEWRNRLSTGLERFAEGGIDVVLLDLVLPDSRGLDTFTKMQEQAPEIPIVVMTGLDDVTLAIKAVRKGAQDYLVKGKVNSSQLVRAILYAIARRLGEERRFTFQELKEFNGKEGRPVYIAFKGKVYDVSSSIFWKEGIHVGNHYAGNDLTENMAKAPHGEEVLSRFHVVGEISHEESLRQRLVRRIRHRLVERIGEMHVHPTLVKFSTAYSVAVPLLAYIYILTGIALFEEASYYVLALGFLILPFILFFGFFTWKVTYGGSTAKIFIRKIVLATVLIATTTVCFAWRTWSPNVLVTSDVNYAYLALLTSMVPMVRALGHSGGEIVGP